MNGTRQVWESQMESINGELVRTGALIDIDGRRYVDPTVAGDKLVSLYSRMTSIGYANGWC